MVPHWLKTIWRAFDEFSDATKTFADFMKAVKKEYVGEDGIGLFSRRDLDLHVESTARAGMRAVQLMWYRSYKMTWPGALAHYTECVGPIGLGLHPGPLIPLGQPWQGMQGSPICLSEGRYVFLPLFGRFWALF